MIELIVSPQNAKLKLAASLKKKKYRDAHGLFLAEGIRLCEEAAKSSWPVSFCLYHADQKDDPRLASLLAVLVQKSVPVYRIEKDLYDKISDTQEPQGILLVMEKREFSFADLPNRESEPFFFVLDCLQDPGNVGAIIRTADAAGCAGIILTKNTVDLFSAKVVRATMGSLFHLPVIASAQVDDVIVFLRKHNIPLYAAALDNKAKSYFLTDFTKSGAVVLGNEGNGVQDEFLHQCDEKIFIPLLGEAESLNVSIAAAVIAYEAVRQRLFPDIEVEKNL